MDVSCHNSIYDILLLKKTGREIYFIIDILPTCVKIGRGIIKKGMDNGMPLIITGQINHKYFP